MKGKNCAGHQKKSVKSAKWNLVKLRGCESKENARALSEELGKRERAIRASFQQENATQSEETLLAYAQKIVTGLSASAIKTIGIQRAF